MHSRSLGTIDLRIPTMPVLSVFLPWVDVTRSFSLSFIKETRYSCCPHYIVDKIFFACGFGSVDGRESRLTTRRTGEHELTDGQKYS